MGIEGMLRLLSCPFPDSLQQGHDRFQDAPDPLLLQDFSCRGDGLGEMEHKGDDQPYTQRTDLIKQVMQKTAFLPMFAMMIIVVFIVVAMPFLMSKWVGVITFGNRFIWRLGSGPLDDPVELSLFEPYPPALRAVIDLGSQSFHHQ